MQKIKVLHILESMNCGGIETFLINIYRNINREKIQFDFLTLNDDKFFYEDEVRKLGGNIYRYEQKSTKFVSHTFNIIKTLKTKGPYQVVHVHYTNFNGFALFLAWLYGIKIRISHAHIINKKSGKIFKDIYNFFFNKMIPVFATNKFACSQEAGIMLYKKSNNFQTMNNGINLDKFCYSSSIRQSVRKSLSIENSFVVTHIGRLEKEKNHNFILDVFYEIVKKEPQSILLIIGCGSLQKELEKKTIALGLTNKVKFLGVIQNTYEILQAADVFLFPSTYEALGIAAIEAQAAGLPCLLAESIPKEAFIINAYPLALNLAPTVWAEKALSFKSIDRQDTSFYLKQSGFDINDTVHILEEVYKKN